MTRALLLAVLLVSSLFTARLQADELVLNGSATFSQLTRDYYIAGLYLSQPSDSPDTILASQANQEMRLLIRARWTPRKWRKMWQANISINNATLPNNPASREALMAFIDLPETPLQQDDMVRIQVSAGGTRVYLNNELAIRAPSRDLFGYLLNTWIGKLPPSREFRSQILGQGNDPILAQQLNTHQVPADRKQLISGWQQQKRERLQAAKAARLAEQQRLEQEAQEQQRQEQQRLQQQQEEQRRQQQAERKQRLAAEKQRKAQQQKLSRQQLAEQKKQQQQRAAQQRAAKQQQQLAEQQSYYQQLYGWQLQQALEQEVRYPPWARQFQQQGSVSQTVTLSSGGEITAMQSAAVVDGETELLNEELKRAIRAVSSKVQPPKGLKNAPWQYTLKYRFSLSDSPQPASARPDMPASLAQQAKQAAAVRKQQASQMTVEMYQQQVRDKVAAAVEYPKAAVVLKKQGQVSYLLTLDGNGKISTLEKQTSSRHHELNIALKKAIEHSAPFGTVPGGQTTELTISHDFKL